jgi:hypothetical protein
MTKTITAKHGLSGERAQATAANGHSCRVAVVCWSPPDGLAEAIGKALHSLGHVPLFFDHHAPVPGAVDVVLTFAPYDRLLQIPEQLAALPAGQRPRYVHWNTEGIPDLRLPWTLIRRVAAWRSWLGRRFAGAQRPGRLHRLQQRMLRFRFVGDYHYAHRQGWLPMMADSSAVYTRYHNQHGLPSRHVPWGSTDLWHADLGLDRDIDVLWMGKRSSPRRARLLDMLKAQLERHGVNFYIADDVEHPFIFGEERTHFLNRAKITLNLTRTWYDDNLLRFAITTPNRSLNVSETLLPHCPQFVPGRHYVSAPPDQLAETLLYYLQHADERAAIVENAYRLSTETLTLKNSVAAVLAIAHAGEQAAHGQPAIRHTP